jgi:hypothetical protein
MIICIAGGVDDGLAGGVMDGLGLAGGVMDGLGLAGGDIDGLGLAGGDVGGQGQGGGGGVLWQGQWHGFLDPGKCGIGGCSSSPYWPNSADPAQSPHCCVHGPDSSRQPDPPDPLSPPTGSLAGPAVDVTAARDADTVVACAAVPVSNIPATPAARKETPSAAGAMRFIATQSMWISLTIFLLLFHASYSENYIE